MFLCVYLSLVLFLILVLGPGSSLARLFSFSSIVARVHLLISAPRGRVSDKGSRPSPLLPTGAKASQCLQFSVLCCWKINK